MKRLILSASLMLGAALLPSCGVAEGLGKAVSRTGGSLSRSVSNLGGAFSR